MLKRLLLSIALVASAAPVNADMLIPGGYLSVGVAIGGSCTAGYVLYNNGGVLGCQAASLTIGGSITGSTAGYGLYVSGASLGQFAYGTGVFTALGLPTGAAGGFTTYSGAHGTPSSITLTNATGLPLTSGVTGLLPVANGGTGTASPAIVAGTNITVSGTWPNQTINASGGSGSGTVSSGTTNALAFYAASGTTVSPLTLGTNLSITGSTLNASGSGGSGLTVGTTAITGGASGYLGYNNGGVYGETTTPAVTSLALGGATIGTNALAVTGTANISGNVALGGNITIASGTTNSLNFVSASASFGYGFIDSSNLFNPGTNVLGYKNGTSAASFKVANTWSSSGTNYEYGVFDWQTTANTLTIGTTMGGTGVARNLEFVVGGVDKGDFGVSSGGSWTFTGTGSSPNYAALIVNETQASGYVSASFLLPNLAASSTGYPVNLGVAGSANNSVSSAFYYAGAGSAANQFGFGFYGGVSITWGFSANTTNPLFYFGGTTVSYPALRRNGAVLQAYLADGSALTAFSASTVQTGTAYTVSTLPTGSAGMRAYVTDAVACTLNGALTGSGSVACPVWYNGTAWIGG